MLNVRLVRPSWLYIISARWISALCVCVHKCVIFVSPWNILENSGYMIRTQDVGLFFWFDAAIKLLISSFPLSQVLVISYITDFTAYKYRLHYLTFFKIQIEFDIPSRFSIPTPMFDTIWCTTKFTINKIFHINP